MKGRRTLGLTFAAVGIAGAALCLLMLVALRDTVSADPLLTLALGSMAVLGVAVGALWVAVDRLLLRGVTAVAGEARLLAHGGVGAQVPVDRYAALAPLPEAINELGERLVAARGDVDRAVAASTAQVEEQRARLAAVLRDLHDGVMVCNLSHQVLLYNQTALRLLHLTGDLGLGRDFLSVMTPAPVLHTLERLRLRYQDGRHLSHPMGVSADFVAGTVDGRYVLQGTMSLMLQDEAISGYVVTFSDVTDHLAALGKRDALLRAATEGFRAPIANLRAASETLDQYADLPPEDRRPFEEVLTAECAQLSQRLEGLTAEYRSLVTGGWPMSDVHSGNLINLVIARAGASGGPSLTLTGLPQWLHGDSHSLVVMLDHLARRLAEATGVGSFDLSADATAPWVFVDLSWEGRPVASSTVDGWLDQVLPDALGGLTVGDVLQHHRSDLWSEAVDGERARLRVPLPPSVQLHGHANYVPPVPRPEFFDFGLLHQPLATSELGRRPLRELTFVVFDTETTGLRPSDGDEILSIAGVRIVNGRILTGEIFAQFVNPGRPIPKESVRFHGISEDMVQDKPRIEQVLPQFKAFVSGAVLVAHNAAFDLKFLKMKERATGVRFDNPVLDTMLLSRQLQGQDAEHALDDIARRLGVQVVDRHTALGDAFLTAAIFLRFVDMLGERGIHTLDDAIRSANILVELQARERAF